MVGAARFGTLRSDFLPKFSFELTYTQVIARHTERIEDIPSEARDGVDETRLCVRGELEDFDLIELDDDFFLGEVQVGQVFQHIGAHDQRDE